MNPSLFFASNIDTRTAIGPRKGLINIALHAVAPAEIDPAATEGAVVFGISGHTVREVGVSRRRFKGFGGYYDETVTVQPEGGAIRFEQRRKFRVGLDVLALDTPIELDSTVLASLPELQVTQRERARVTDAVPITPLAGQAIWARVREQALPVLAALADGQRVGDFLDQQALHAMLARRDLGADQKAAMAEAFHGRGAFRATLEARGYGCPFSDAWDELDRDDLRVCFIKPWRLATDAEKVDPNNALLIDKTLADAFTFGALTMTPDGHPWKSSQAGPELFDQVTSLRADDLFPRVLFTPEQQRYLRYHNAHVFKR